MGVTGPEEVQPSSKTDEEASVGLNTFSFGAIQRALKFNRFNQKVFAVELH